MASFTAIVVAARAVATVKNMLSLESNRALQSNQLPLPYLGTSLRLYDECVPIKMFTSMHHCRPTLRNITMCRSLGKHEALGIAALKCSKGSAAVALGGREREREGKRERETHTHAYLCRQVATAYVCLYFGWINSHLAGFVAALPSALWHQIKVLYEASWMKVLRMPVNYAPGKTPGKQWKRKNEA